MSLSRWGASGCLGLLVGAWRPTHPPRTYASITRLEAHVFAVIERMETISHSALRDTLHLSAGALATAELRLARHGMIRQVDST